MMIKGKKYIIILQASQVLPRLRCINEKQEEKKNQTQYDRPSCDNLVVRQKCHTLWLRFGAKRGRSMC